MIGSTGNNFTFINQAGASISTTGRFAVAAQNFNEDITATIVNDGTLIAADDAIRFQSGTITNSGLIESTGETASGNGEFACLLYTSPSPRDATLSRMPSSA